MNKNHSTFNEHDTFMKDLEELSDIEEEDDIFTSDLHKEKNDKKENKIEENFEGNNTNNDLLSKSDFVNFMNKISILNENSLNSFNCRETNSQENKIFFTISSQCNKYISEINSEINIAIKALKALYSEIFPELTSIVLNTYDYVVTVKSLVNSNDISKVDLSYLPGNIQLSLNVLISTKSNKSISQEKRSYILKECDKILQMHSYLKNILKFIEAQMASICPNLTALVGANIASKLVTSAGGIEELAKIPAGNVLVMGSQRVNTEGFSTKGKLHMGFLADIEEVQKTPEKFKLQILRKYAGKAVLMARIDAFRKPRINTEEELDSVNNIKTVQSVPKIEPKEGEQFKEHISMKMNKIIEPQQAAARKPLPKPDEKPRKKRGGKRMRSIKEKYALTEMRMMKNRMNFGPEGQIEYRETGEGLGLLGVGGTGGKMKTTIKAHRFNTKREKMLAMESQTIKDKYSHEKEASGLQSSVAFTPAVGMELINPDLLEKKYKETTDKYFSSTSGFATVISQKKKGSNSLYEI